MLCLTTSTDARWAERAADNLPILLSDHAHCEMKAASNALSLAARIPQLPKVARVLVALAKEELDHYDAVLAELERREVALPPPGIDDYAVELRKATRRQGKPTFEAALLDRFLIAALIEARSCERLGMLSKTLQARGDGRLATFYDELFVSEARHYTTFVELATDIFGDEPKVRSRLTEIASSEGKIAAKLGVHPTVHG